jgi:hypothetical protein
MKRFLFLLPLVGAVQAQPLRDAAVAELVNQLTPAPTRRFLNLTKEKRQIDQVINFDSTKRQDSNQLLPEKLAEARRTERLQALRFEVEGHRYCKGCLSDWIVALSDRYAQAVLEYLQAKCGVPSAANTRQRLWRTAAYGNPE